MAGARSSPVNRAHHQPFMSACARGVRRYSARPTAHVGGVTVRPVCTMSAAWSCASLGRTRRWRARTGAHCIGDQVRSTCRLPGRSGGLSSSVLVECRRSGNSPSSPRTSDPSARWVGRGPYLCCGTGRICRWLRDLDHRPGEGVELDDLFVDPNWRRRVIANPHALALYRQLGFVDVGETNTEFGTAPRMAS